MSTPASTSNGLFKLNVTQASNSAVVDTAALQLPLNFNGTTFTRVVNGTYTPHNDTQQPVTFGSLAPTWIVVIVDQLTNVQVVGQNTNDLQFLPIIGISLSTFADVSTSSNALESIVLNGTTAAFTPMAQGVTVNYTIAYGDGTLSL